MKLIAEVESRREKEREWEEDIVIEKDEGFEEDQLDPDLLKLLDDDVCSGGEWEGTKEDLGYEGGNDRGGEGEEEEDGHEDEHEHGVQ